MSIRSVRKIRPSDIPGRRSRYDLGPRRPAPADRKALRVAILAKLADAVGPLSAVEVYKAIGWPDGQEQAMADTLAELAFDQLVNTTRHRKTPTGPLVTHYALTAKD